MCSPNLTRTFLLTYEFAWNNNNNNNDNNNNNNKKKKKKKKKNIIIGSCLACVNRVLLKSG